MAIPLIVLAGFIFALLYRGSPNEIVAVANQFQPDPSWVLETETINPPQIICIASVCPQVFRSWTIKSSTGVRLSDLTERLKQLNWTVESEYSCRQDVDITDVDSICHLSGDVSKFKYSIYILPNEGYTNLNLTLE